MRQKRQVRSHCPISFALDLIGDKWSLLVMRDLIFKGKSRYQEFLNSGEGISTNILADRLVQLERDGFIVKKDDPANGKQFLYTPTEKGLDLVPTMLELVRWSGKYDPKTAAPEEFLTELETNQKKLTEKVKKPFLKARK
jgi:DNA-binding HxlR family transcriptional regulator